MEKKQREKRKKKTSRKWNWKERGNLDIRWEMELEGTWNPHPL